MVHDATWMEVGVGPGHIVLDMGTLLPLPKKGTAPAQFLAHVCCSQTAGWIKMPLGMEVGLDPSNIVLDGDPAPLPNFPPMFIVAKRLHGSRCHLV